MKLNKIVCITTLCLTLGSCGKWLTIDPSDQVSERILYSTSEGYQNQLNGIYKSMSTPQLYGRELTWGFLDAMAQYYVFDEGSYGNTYEQVTPYYMGANKYLYEHSSAKPIVKQIWEESFNAIANCNDLIAHAEQTDPKMFHHQEMERDAILGEAHALRAMLHFDMLRLFAPSTAKPNADKHIPYVKGFPIKIPMPLTDRDVLENVMADLLIAEKYTATMDTIRTASVSDLNKRLELTSTSVQRFIEYRGYRLNHYAIKALIARVSLYMGDIKSKEIALKYANELIQLNDDDWFEFTSDYEFKNQNNNKLYGDVIFALYNNKLSDVYRSISVDDKNYLSILDFDGIFGSEAKKDFRALQWEVTSDDRQEYLRSIKINEVKEKGPKAMYCNKMIPMLRMSEIYYIAAECLFAQNGAKATKYLEKVRKERGVSNLLPTASSQDDFNKLILNEMRREMCGEGQLFFFYKRLNMRIETKEGEGMTLDKEFVLPIPESNDIN